VGGGVAEEEEPHAPKEEGSVCAISRKHVWDGNQGLDILDII
jgi:hypothetical protein